MIEYGKAASAALASAVDQLTELERYAALGKILKHIGGNNYSFITPGSFAETIWEDIRADPHVFEAIMQASCKFKWAVGSADNWSELCGSLAHALGRADRGALGDSEYLDKKPTINELTPILRGNDWLVLMAVLHLSPLVKTLKEQVNGTK